MKIAEIIEVIEKIAPPRLAASWDNCGMQVARQEENISRVALCLDPTPASVHEALKGGAQCILSHHPLLMQGRLPSVVDHYHRVLGLLFKNDACLYAAHTSLDINPEGPAGWLAEVLALQQREVLEETGAFADGSPCGFGLVGQLPKALTLDELLHILCEHIDLATATLSGEEPQRIERVAYCTGSGSSLAGLAAQKRAQLFITGDVKYHSALESPLCMLDVGHHSLEEEMMRRLTELLSSALPSIDVFFVPSQSPLRLASQYK